MLAYTNLSHDEIIELLSNIGGEYSWYGVVLHGEYVMKISKQGITLFDSRLSSKIVELLDLKPFSYMTHGNVKLIDCKPYKIHRRSGLLWSKYGENTKPYIHTGLKNNPDLMDKYEYERLDYDSCLMFGYKRLTAFCRNMYLYHKRLICIDFHGHNIKSHPWIEERLRLLFTMPGLDQVIYLNYRTQEGNFKIIVTNRELPNTKNIVYELKLPHNPTEHLAEYVVEYFALNRVNMKSARKV